MDSKFFNKVIFFGSIYTGTNPSKLKMTLDSILNQKNIKPNIYVFCDGDISEILENLLIEYDQYLEIYKSKKNLGLGNALSFLINKIKDNDTSYFSRFDDDDFFHKMKTCLQIKYMKQNKLDICGSWALEQNGNKTFYKTLPVHDKILKERILLRSPFVHSSVIFHKKVFDIFNYDKDYKKLQDYKLWLEISKSPTKIIFGNIPLYLTTQNLSDDFYYKRGYLIAKSEFKLRLGFLKSSFSMGKFFIIIILFLFRISPSKVKKICYENFR